MNVPKDYCLILIVLVACLTSGERQYRKVVKIIKYKNNLSPNGYLFGFRTSNGIERHEEGISKEGPLGKTLSVSGSYEYEVDGIVTLVTFIADENGFKPITQIRRRIDNVLPLNFTLDNRIDPKLLGTLAGGGLG